MKSSIDKIDNNKTKIIIIGAGLAGLTSAYRLNFNQNIDVEIYEARQRVGGRVQTVFIKNLEGDYSNAELGGQEILDGGKALNILNLAEELNIPVKENISTITQLYHKGKNFYDYHQLIAKLPLNNSQIKNKIKKLKYTCRSMQDIIDGFFTNNLLREIFNIKYTEFYGASPVKLGIHHHIDTFLDFILQDIDIHAPFIKHHRKIFKHGNAILPTKLASLLPNKIHLSKVLKSVDYNINNKLSLSFEDGSRVECDQLILAVPAITLKMIYFANNLFAQKQLTMIDKLDYSKAGKIFVPIRYVEGPDLLMSKNFITFFNDDHKLLSVYFMSDKGKIDPIESGFSNKINLINTAYKGSTLCLKTPQHADDRQFSKYESPIIKSWVSDPYAKASYSYYSAKFQNRFKECIIYKGIKLRKIYKPINDKIFFIGEHTSILDEIGTMEAAVESAERTTKLIIKLL